MAIKGYFFNAIESGGVYDRIYNAEDVTSYLDKIVGNGVFPTPSTQLKVTAGTGLQVTVAAGQGWIDGHKLINTAALNLSIDAADVLLDRIDRVVFYADYTARQMGVKVVKGTAASNPTAPALVRSSSEYQMSLATVQIPKTATTLTNAQISDTRADSNVCGWVAGLIQQLDTSQLFTQWETAYSQFYETMQSWQAAQQAAFEEWLANLTDELTVGAYLKGYRKDATIAQGATATVPMDMTGYQYDDSDVIAVYINGLAGIKGTDYSINTATSPVSVDLAFDTSGGANDVTVVALKSILGTPTIDGSRISQLNIGNQELISNTIISSGEVNP